MRGIVKEIGIPTKFAVDSTGVLNLLDQRENLSSNKNDKINWMLISYLSVSS